MYTVEYKRRGEKECYFFTSRVRKYKNGNRPNRACKVGGYWKASGADKPVIDRDSNNSLIGYKKALVFYEGKPPNGTKTKWIMHEFRVSEPPPCTRTGPNDMKVRVYTKLISIYYFFRLIDLITTWFNFFLHI